MKTTTPDVLQSNQCAERLRALGDPLRLRIVVLLRGGPMTVGDIAQFLESEVVTVSHHLQILRHAEIVSPRRDGRFVFYSLCADVTRHAGESRQWLDLGFCRIELPRQS